MPESDLKTFILKNNTMLEQERLKAKRELENANIGFVKAKRLLTKEKERLDNDKIQVMNKIMSKDQFQKMRKEAWANGYYGNIKDIPEIPENF